MRGETEGTSIENMAIDGQALMTLYQKAGIADPTMLDTKNKSV
jgi:hypothetical protein